MPIKVRDLDRCFTGKMRAVRSEGSKHQRYEFRDTDGLILAHTMRSRTRGDISDQLVSKIARQIGINRRQLQDAVSCVMTYEDLLPIMRRAR